MSYFYEVRIFCFVLLILSSILSKSQDRTNDQNFSLGLNYLPNKILLHKPDFHFKPNSTAQAFELSLKKQMMGEKQWHQKYGFPEVGLNLSYANYDFRAFGHVVGFYPSIQFRLMSFKESNIFLKVGGGLGLSSKRWSREHATDSFSYFIGSRLNNFTMFEVGYLSKISRHWTGQIGIDFYHVSNAATRQPNYGINTTGVFVGMNYHPKGVVTSFQKRSYKKMKNPIRLGLASSIAFVEASAFNGPLFKVYSQSVSLSKKYREKSRVWLVVNANFKERTFAGFKNITFDSKSSWNRTWQFSLSAKNEFLFGRVGLPLALGYYLNDPTGNLKLYQSLGMNYYCLSKSKGIIKDGYFSLILHTHISKAQYAEMGIGILF